VCGCVVGRVVSICDPGPFLPYTNVLQPIPIISSITRPTRELQTRELRGAIQSIHPSEQLSRWPGWVASTIWHRPSKFPILPFTLAIPSSRCSGIFPHSIFLSRPGLSVAVAHKDRGRCPLTRQSNREPRRRPNRWTTTYTTNQHTILDPSLNLHRH
jgi:hypothetical protein